MGAAAAAAGPKAKAGPTRGRSRGPAVLPEAEAEAEGASRTMENPTVPPVPIGRPVVIHVGTPTRDPHERPENGSWSSGSGPPETSGEDEESIESTESERRQLRRRRAPSVARARRGKGPHSRIASTAESFEKVVQIIPDGTPLQQVRQAEQQCFGCCWSTRIETECYVCHALFYHDCDAKRCLCLCRTRLMYPDGRQGQLDAPPTVMHNVMIGHRSWGEDRPRALAAERQEALIRDEVKQERRQLAAYRREAESGQSQTHWMWDISALDATTRYRDTADRHEFPVGSLVRRGDRVMTVIGHAMHGTYHFAEARCENVRWCDPPHKLRAVGRSRDRRAVRMDSDSESG